MLRGGAVAHNWRHSLSAGSVSLRDAYDRWCGVSSGQWRGDAACSLQTADIRPHGVLGGYPPSGSSSSTTERSTPGWLFASLTKFAT